ncbi:hypothetical protein COT65_00170 [Candidatus Shapirobacteria bacterium CG09_land_8_20_14_0_10_47_13]|uniref:GHMP kinase C-terminal domain-containing protein n=1 Tax=Candidatus Shapirobacteria bacterium CG09_land_8_20_14_0_10_47_13 TaxID=1974481 RepID=A0A2H0WNI4_9BACT|nr:MAG: hypothetical protein COT65_00170 [Candidatus Shapirobacteria bacterium CG09_land_8_20_14_0_10_47_13]
METRDIKTVGRAIEKVDSDEVIMQGYNNMFPGISEQYKSLVLSLQHHGPICTFISSAGPTFITICSMDKQEEIANIHRNMGLPVPRVLVKRLQFENWGKDLKHLKSQL